VRDADALIPGGPQPLGDPTGWRAMGASGTRPLGKPLVSRSETDMTTVSASSTATYAKYNFSSSGVFIPNLSAPDIDRTPRPDVYGQDTYLSSGNKSQPCFDVGALSAEPEPLIMDDFSRTPMIGSSAQLGPSINTGSPMHTNNKVQSPIINQPPKPVMSPSIAAGLNLRQSSASLRSQNTASSTSSGSSKKSSMTDTEKRRYELQLRVYRARTQMPSHIPLRVFREPSECVEAQEILDRERS